MRKASDGAAGIKSKSPGNPTVGGLLEFKQAGDDVAITLLLGHGHQASVVSAVVSVSLFWQGLTVGCACCLRC